jgi:hypothetical protein
VPYPRCRRQARPDRDFGYLILEPSPCREQGEASTQLVCPARPSSTNQMSLLLPIRPDRPKPPGCVVAKGTVLGSAPTTNQRTDRSGRTLGAHMRVAACACEHRALSAACAVINILLPICCFSLLVAPEPSSPKFNSVVARNARGTTGRRNSTRVRLV